MRGKYLNLKKRYPIILCSFSFALQLSAQVLLWSDDMSNFPTNWTTGGTGGPWTKVNTRSKSEPYSAKCTPNPDYSNNQDNWMQRSINLSGYENGSIVFSVWLNTEANVDYIYFEYLQSGNWITHWASSGNLGGFDQKVMTNIPNNATAIRFRFQSNASITAEGVYIDDVMVYGYRYDVGATIIFAPTGTIDSGQVITPSAQVYNYGDFISTFFVRFRIGTFYSNDQQVLNLSPGASRNVNFTNWTALQRGTWVVSCSTRHPNDVNRSNDKVTNSVTVRVRDVGTVSIVAPTGTVDSGQIITPKALIRNYGTTQENFSVFFWISSFYSSSRNITLNPGETLTVSFDNWTALPRGTHTTKCSTALTDMVMSNNRRTDSVFVQVKDVGVTTIIAPIGTVDSGPSITPQSRIRNYGTDTETFQAQFRITGPNGTWISNKTVSNLIPNEERTVNFDPWSIGPRGNYTVRCTTALAGDMIPSNDKLDGVFQVQVHDVSVLAINSPPSSVDSSTTVSCEATIRNFGTYNETFDVQFRIGTFYSSTRNISLSPGSQTLVTFDNWNVLSPRGNYSLKCTTQLNNDANHSNDAQTGNVTVYVHDVGVTLINSPSANVDSGTTVPVQATVRNFGTYNETFDVRFRIDTFYLSSRTLNLGPGAQSLVTFDNWTVSVPRGNYSLKCSTQLSSDANRSNDAQTGNVTVQVHDVGVTTINSPSADVDSGTSVPVTALVKNFGTYNETFDVRFRIGTFYLSSRTLNLGPGAQSLVTFDNWTVSVPRGNYSLKCSTQLSSDANRSNDAQTGNVTVQVHDVGVLSTNLPSQVDSGTTLPVQATFKNFGTYNETFSAVLRIGSSYQSIRGLTLGPEESATTNFDDWVVTERGLNPVVCSSQAENDGNPLNDTILRTVLVIVRDVSVLEILQPKDTFTQGVTINPTITCKNLGTITETFVVRFQIDYNYSTVYYESSTVILEPGQILPVNFAPFYVRNYGNFITTAWSELSGDRNPRNDTVISSFVVNRYVAWIQKRDLPTGPKGKRVKDGGSLVYTSDNLIFALKGGNTNEFYLYDITQDTWTMKCSIPYGMKPKRVKKGGRLTYGKGLIYALKGNNTLEFYKYELSKDSWKPLNNVPIGGKKKKIKGGAGLVFVETETQDLVYLVKGGKTTEFYAYDCSGDTWITKQNIPTGISGKGAGPGSCITYDNNNTIFLLKDKSNEFYTYNIEKDSWTVKNNLPLIGSIGKKKKVKDGAALAFDGNNLVYAFKGGNTCEFWAYDVSKDSWYEATPIPRGPSNKRVKGGGSLTYASGKVFALKGSNTLEFWRYSPLSFLTSISEPENTMADLIKRPSGLTPELQVTPNPVRKIAYIRYRIPHSARLRLFDITGKLVVGFIPRINQEAEAILDAENLPVGIYFLRLEATNYRLIKKIIIAR